MAMLIECVPELVGAAITQQLNIPTIGIGAGVHTSGQVCSGALRLMKQPRR